MHSDIIEIMMPQGSNEKLPVHEMDPDYTNKNLHSPIKVSSDKLLDAGLAGGVQVLKLMHG